MKAKRLLIANQTPWRPDCWVGDGGVPVRVALLSDDSRRKYAAMKINVAILRAIHHDDC